MSAGTVYVAAKTPERFRALSDLATSMGFTVAFDWTVFPRGCRDPEAAEAMKRVVQQSDALALDASSPEMLGAYVEFGIALGLDLPCYLFAPHSRTTDFRDSLFWRCENVHLYHWSYDLFSDLKAELDGVVRVRSSALLPDGDSDDPEDGTIPDEEFLGPVFDRGPRVLHGVELLSIGLTKDPLPGCEIVVVDHYDEPDFDPPHGGYPGGTPA